MAEWIEIATKIAAYAAVIIAVGISGVRLLLLRVDTVDVDGDARVERGLTRAAGVAALLLLLGVAIRAVAHTATAFGWADTWSIENLRLIALESRWGEGWRLQAAAAAAWTLVVVLARLAPGRSTRAVMGLAALTACAALPQTGHAASEPYRWVLHALHIAAAGCWAGTLLVLALWIRNAAPDALVPLLRRFSTLAAIAVAVVGASGAIAAVFYVGEWRNLWNSEYGLVLLTKIGLVGLMGVAGAINWTYLHRRGEAVAPRTVQIEAVLAIAVIVITGWLTETAHP
ncbi:MAG: CopD family protein [Vicinamibacterales bacterium]